MKYMDSPVSSLSGTHHNPLAYPPLLSPLSSPGFHVGPLPHQCHLCRTTRHPRALGSTLAQPPAALDRSRQHTCAGWGWMARSVHRPLVSMAPFRRAPGLLRGVTTDAMRRAHRSHRLHLIPAGSSDAIMRCWQCSGLPHLREKSTHDTQWSDILKWGLIRCIMENLLYEVQVAPECTSIQYANKIMES